MIKVSVIIPVYNSELFIEQCIASLLNQTMRDIEVIAVNDGSTDGSKAILDKLAVIDSRLQVFHTYNQGVSASRNLGLQYARGAYIAFTDADDWAEPIMLEELFNALTNNNCGWAICNVNVVQNEKLLKVRLKLPDEVIDVYGKRTEFLRNLMGFKYDYSNWNKLYTASVIREKKLQFAEEMSIWEDLLFNLQYLQYVKQVAIISKPLYNYRVLSTALFSGKSKELTPQFNLLYMNYLAFATPVASSGENQVFKEEIARIAYYQLLQDAAIKVDSQQLSFRKSVDAFEKEIAAFESGIFSYEGRETSGVQRFKRKMLQDGKFRWYAFVMVSRYWLQKKYSYFSRFLNGNVEKVNAH